MLGRPKYNRVGNRIILTKDYTFTFGGYIFTLKKGYYSDGASIPKFMHWLYKPFDTETVLGAFYHDSFYWTKKLKRNKADELFYYLMKEQDTPFAQRLTMYLAVRCWGWIFYYGKKKPSEYKIRKYLIIKKFYV